MNQDNQVDDEYLHDSYEYTYGGRPIPGAYDKYKNLGKWFLIFLVTALISASLCYCVSRGWFS